MFALIGNVSVTVAFPVSYLSVMSPYLGQIESPLSVNSVVAHPERGIIVLLGLNVPTKGRSFLSREMEDIYVGMFEEDVIFTSIVFVCPGPIVVELTDGIIDILGGGLETWLLRSASTHKRPPFIKDTADEK